MMGIPCPTNPTYEAMYDSKNEIATFDVSVGINIYNFTLSTSQICYTQDGINDRYCEPLDVFYNTGAGNKIQNTKQEFFSKYGIEYDELLVRDTSTSVYKTVQNHPDQNCFTLNDDMLNDFPDEFSEDLERATEEEFHNDPQIYPPGVYTGYGMESDKDFALDFVKKYDFNATTQAFSDNIASIPDKQYRFDCFFDYSDKQYMLRLEFEQQIHDGNFINVNVTRNDQGIPTIINNDIAVYSGGFNSTVLFHNKLDSDIVLSTNEPVVYMVDQDGDIYENTFAKTLTEFEQVIPPEKFFAYYFASHREKTNQPITYTVEPFGLKGSVTLKQYPHCMTEDQVISLYNEVKVYPKFPNYLPDGYSFECGVHNTNAFVHFVYFTDEQRSQFDDKINSAFNREFLADGGLVIDYYDEAWNGWNEDPNYDKHARANEKAQHPWAETYIISGEPAVMIEEYFWQSGEQRSFNRLEVFFDEDKVRISSSLPKDELIKIAESLN